MVRRLHSAEPTVAESLIETVRQRKRPFQAARDLDVLLHRIGDARCVLLGEASHGTHEFYDWRASITKRLIQEKGFSFIAVEGDWPDCARINRYVKKESRDASAAEVLHRFDRWPTWMWANHEVEHFAEWLRTHNDRRAPEAKAGFYGLDVYSLWDSLYQVASYLRRTDGEALKAAKAAFRCFEPYGEDAQSYAAATRFLPESCEDEVIKLLASFRSRPTGDTPAERDARFEAEQNAIVLKNAETYYRTMVKGRTESWNVRDHHMAETLERLLVHHGPGAKAVVWEHNTHIGDAHYTDMVDDGMVNLGQLARDRYGQHNVFLFGFGTYAGSVIAAEEWDAPHHRMTVPPARMDSWEHVLHRAFGGDAMLLFDHDETDRDLCEWRGHRAIDVIYHPEMERYGNYVPTMLPRRYNGFAFLDRTQALHPLRVGEHEREELPETFPTGY